MPDIRLLLTYDFFGSFAANPTSWGKQPGGSALRATVDRLREAASSSCWLDIGDFAGGGPLAPATDGQLSWAAAAELGFDAAVPGNHEFDYGDSAVLTWANRMPFPLIAADQELAELSSAFRPYWIVQAPSGRTAAIIGLNLAERRGLRVWTDSSDLDTAAKTTIDLARQLRGDVDHIFVALHEGMWSFGATGEPVGGQRMHDFCAAVRGTVDGVFGAHSIAYRHIGTIAGVPYIQPWALGVEVGVVDIDDHGVHLSSTRVDSALGDDLGWNGTGSGLLTDLRNQVIGELPRPLSNPPIAGTDNLGSAVTQGMLAVTGADVALTTTTELGAGQVPIDGVNGYLAAGPVSEADLLRILPWPRGTRGDETWAAELTADEVALLTAKLNFVFTSDGFTDRSLRRPDRPAGLTVLSSNFVRSARTLLSRDVDWHPTGFGLRDGLRNYLAGMA